MTSKTTSKKSMKHLDKLGLFKNNDNLLVYSNGKPTSKFFFQFLCKTLKTLGVALCCEMSGVANDAHSLTCINKNY